VRPLRQATQDANAKPVRSMAEQNELEKLRAQSLSTLCWRQPEEMWINKPPEDPESILVPPLIRIA